MEQHVNAHEQRPFPHSTGSLALAAGLIPLLLAAALGLSSCSSAESREKAVAPPTAVTIAPAEQREINDWDEFSGRFEAVEHVELRPRVSGYIEALHFTEGHEVKKGDTLFEIDARAFRVELQRAQSELARVQAQAALADDELRRAEQLFELRAVSEQERDRRASLARQARAEQAAAQAAVAAAQLNLSYTRVTAPIDGRVSRAAVTAGNYVSAGETVLTSVVSLDPIYVSFEGDEQRYLRYAQRAQSDGGGNAVFVGLADEDGFPHAGELDFIDNALDPATGTIRTRARLRNAEHRFTPGLFARVRVPGSGRYAATLVPDAAVATDQDRRYVYVVNADDVVEYRAVQLGGTQDAQRVVRSGLNAGERIVVGGLQRVRPGQKVAPAPQALAADRASLPNS